MAYHNGARTVARRESAAALGFYSIFYQLTAPTCLAKGVSRKLHTIARRPRSYTHRSQVLPSRQAPFITSWWHPKTPVTEEILDENEVRDGSPMDGSNKADGTVNSTSSDVVRKTEELNMPEQAKLALSDSDKGLLEPTGEKSTKGLIWPLRLISSQSNRPGTKWSLRQPVVERVIEKEPSGSPTVVTEDLRALMRRQTAPVVVLTTNLDKSLIFSESAPVTSGTDNLTRGSRIVPVGMTLSSFTTLSLSPEPLISFNIKSDLTNPSKTLLALERNRSFLIHFLTDTLEGMHIAELFSAGNGGYFGPDLKGISGIYGVDQVRAGAARKVLPNLCGDGIQGTLACEILSGGIGQPGTDLTQPFPPYSWGHTIAREVGANFTYWGYTIPTDAYFYPQDRTQKAFVLPCQKIKIRPEFPGPHTLLGVDVPDGTPVPAGTIELPKQFRVPVIKIEAGALIWKCSRAKTLRQSRMKRLLRVREPRPEGMIRIGDHIMCIAKVLNVNQKFRDQSTLDRCGIGYMGGMYRHPGKAIKAHGRE